MTRRPKDSFKCRVVTSDRADTLLTHSYAIIVGNAEAHLEVPNFLRMGDCSRTRFFRDTRVKVHEAGASFSSGWLDRVESHLSH